MKKIWIVLGIVAVVAVMLFSWYRNGYDQAVSKDENVKSSWAQVENQLQRRNDLVPNLVNTVKGFAEQEKGVFTEVTRLRSQWSQAGTVESKIENANQMSAALSRLLLVSENYPELKSNENFLSLQAQLEGTENRIAVERMRYNNAVMDLNRFQRTFFGRFFASQAGVDKPAAYFEANKASKDVPAVVF
ncbi:MAG TPA: LemA family protein [Candidatus Omnitrophota bacterium]|nr:LemA family protein [Candidatus Omnitrophota bacterium]